MLSKFFLDRPVFAWVIALIIMVWADSRFILCHYAVSSHCTALHPDRLSVSLAPLRKPWRDSITQIIEQQMTGLDKMLYMTSSSDSSGISAIDLDFCTRDRSGPGLGQSTKQAPAGYGPAAGNGSTARCQRS